MDNFFILTLCRAPARNEWTSVKRRENEKKKRQTRNLLLKRILWRENGTLQANLNSCLFQSDTNHTAWIHRFIVQLHHTYDCKTLHRHFELPKFRVGVFYSLHFLRLRLSSCTFCRIWDKKCRKLCAKSVDDTIHRVYVQTGNRIFSILRKQQQQPQRKIFISSFDSIVENPLYNYTELYMMDSSCSRRRKSVDTSFLIS